MADFKDERNGTGTKEWSETSINIQKGCQNDCMYCYAAQMANRFGWRKREDWAREELTKVATRKSFPAREGVVMFPTSHDITPFNIEGSIRVLKLNLEKGNKVLIVSKPRLECISRLVAELEPWKAQVMFRFTIGTLREETSKFWEPGAPLPSERLACLSLAFEAGFETSVSSEPMLGGVESTITVVEACRPYITDTIWLGKMNRVQVAPEHAEAAKEIKRLQRDDEIMKLYRHYEKDLLVSWKDSIKAVVIKDNK